MKTILSTFIAVICASTAVIADDKPALTGVDSLAANPGDYTGKIVAVWASSSVFPRQSECSRLLMRPRLAVQMAVNGR